jgi:hypothetical protein
MVKLDRILEDLSSNDRDIQILALTAIPRIASDMEIPTDVLEKLQQRLEPVATSDDPDLIFLGRKALNFLASRPASRTPPPSETATPLAREAAPPAPEAVAAPADRAAGPRQDPEEELLHRSAGQLAGALSRETDSTRLTMLLAGARNLQDGAVVAAVKELLAHPEARVRANAAEVYGSLAGEEAIGGLLPLLSDPNNRVRSNVARMIGSRAIPEVTACLKEMLASPQVGMRESALFALSGLPDLDLVGDLAPLVTDAYSGVRQRLVELLTERPGPTATELLERLVHDPDAPVRDSAVSALAGRGAPVGGVLDAAVRAAGTAPIGAEPAAGLADEAEQVLVDDEAVEKGFKATLAHIHKELKSAQKRATLSRALFQAGVRGYQHCRSGDLRVKEALVLYYEVEAYQKFLRDYSRRLAKAGTAQSKMQMQLVVTGLAQYQGRLKVALIQLGRVVGELARAGRIDLPPDLLTELVQLLP